MAAIDFPNAPAANQIFVAPNGVTYQWTGTLWLPIGGTHCVELPSLYQRYIWPLALFHHS